MPGRHVGERPPRPASPRPAACATHRSVHQRRCLVAAQAPRRRRLLWCIAATLHSGGMGKGQGRSRRQRRRWRHDPAPAAMRNLLATPSDLLKLQEVGKGAAAGVRSKAAKGPAPAGPSSRSDARERRPGAGQAALQHARAPALSAQGLGCRAGLVPLAQPDLVDATGSGDAITLFGGASVGRCVCVWARAAAPARTSAPRWRTPAWLPKANSIGQARSPHLTLPASILHSCWARKMFALTWAPPLGGVVCRRHKVWQSRAPRSRPPWMR